MINIILVTGARPQFVKVAPLIHELQSSYWKDKISFIHIHTGQHYDIEMSKIFFTDLGLPEPDYHFELSKEGKQAKQTAEVMCKTEEIFISENPDIVVVFGDTNTTLAATISAVKLGIPVVHIEAGLRSYDYRMPEEYNRRMTDHASLMLFTPSENGYHTLLKENIPRDRVFKIGDIMVDTLLKFKNLSQSKASEEIKRIISKNPKFILLTMHRAENVDHREKLATFLTNLKDTPYPVIFPIHPRTMKRINQFNLNELVENNHNLILIKPVGYLDMIALLNNCIAVFTDSGGLQKEAFVMNKPCFILRETTEWVEILEYDGYHLIGYDVSKAINILKENTYDQISNPPIFGDGNTSFQILEKLYSGWNRGLFMLPIGKNEFFDIN